MRPWTWEKCLHIHKKRDKSCKATTFLDNGEYSYSVSKRKKWRIVCASYITVKKCHLRARGSEVLTLEPLSERSLNALPVFAWTSSGWSAFLPRSKTCGRVFGIYPAALAWGTDLGAGVGPRTRRRDSPQLLKPRGVKCREGRKERCYVWNWSVQDLSGKKNRIH